MQRIVIILGVGCLVAMCAGGMWLASRPPIQMWLPPDATDSRLGVGYSEWTLTYRTAHPLSDWYFALVRQLEAAGWTRRETGYAGRPLPLLDPVAYERRTLFAYLVLWERVEITGDLHIAQVRMRRWITIHPPKRVSTLANEAGPQPHPPQRPERLP
jgi:hypothetical protein